MNSSLFNNDELNELFLNGKVKEVKQKIDESLSEMGGEYEESLHFDLIQDAYTLSAYLKEQNSSYLENLTSVVDQIEKNKLDGINNSSDYEKVKNRSEQLNESNENNMKYFIENYFCNLKIVRMPFAIQRQNSFHKTFHQRYTIQFKLKQEIANSNVIR